MNKFKYFQTIVESNFNLTDAAKKLYMSQPALSKFVANLEEELSVSVFVRKKGRIVGLTKFGDYYYTKAREIITIQDEIDYKLTIANNYSVGEVTIGIPPLVISVLFTEFLNEILRLNPFLKIIIIEEGAQKLMERLEEKTLDIAILLQPNEINHKLFTETLIFEDELSAFVNNKNPLAEKDFVTWKEIAEQPLVIFNQDYMIHHQLVKKFKDLNLFPDIRLEMQSWDFLVSSVRLNNLVSILPKPSDKWANLKDISVKPIEDPIPWKVSMVHSKHKESTLFEHYLIYSIENYFLKNKPVQAFEMEMN